MSALAGQLQAQVIDVRTAQSLLLQHGPPAYLAGNQGTIQVLADTHRSTAAALRNVLSDGQTAALGLTGGGSWQGPASEAFTGSWARVHGRIESLAVQHDGFATTLDGIAGEAGRINGSVMSALDQVPGWIGEAEAAIATAMAISWVAKAVTGSAAMEAGVIEGLLGRGRILLTNLRQALTDVEQFTATLPRRLTVDLTFAAEVITIPGIGLRTGPLINVPGERPPSLLTSRPPGQLPPRPPVSPPIPRPQPFPPGGRGRPDPRPVPDPRPRPLPPKPGLPPAPDPEPGPSIGVPPPQGPHGPGPVAQPQGIDVSVPLLPIIAIITTIIARVKGRGEDGKKGGDKGDKGGKGKGK